jgi:tetratricopeptide (TPR) repeat protein
MTPAMPYGRIGRFLGAAVCAIALGACGTAPQKAAQQAARPPLDALMAQAAQASSAGHKEQAVTAWKQAAAAYPADKTPWSNIAQARFDAGQYGEAILNAQEVLVRDPNDRLANSIIAISGLRLSTRALADLSRQNNLSGSIRTESQDLAKLLRESLGEQVLVPPAAAPAPSKANVAKGKKGKAKGDEASSADPFGALK